MFSAVPLVVVQVGLVVVGCSRLLCGVVGVGGVVVVVGVLFLLVEV